MDVLTVLLGSSALLALVGGGMALSAFSFEPSEDDDNTSLRADPSGAGSELPTEGLAVTSVPEASAVLPKADAMPAYIDIEVETTEISLDSGDHSNGTASAISGDTYVLGPGIGPKVPVILDFDVAVDHIQICFDRATLEHGAVRLAGPVSAGGQDHYILFFDGKAIAEVQVTGGAPMLKMEHMSLVETGPV